jgi:hypothetical protein
VKLKRRDMLVAAVAVGASKGEAQEAVAPAELLDLAKRSMQSNRDAINKVKLPMAVEPAFLFKA